MGASGSLSMFGFDLSGNSTKSMPEYLQLCPLAVMMDQATLEDFGTLRTSQAGMEGYTYDCIVNNLG